MAGKDEDRLEAKVTALLAISVDQYLRETGLAKPRPRTIDKMLTDAGLSVKEVSSVLGKTEQAVYQALQSGDKKRPKPRAGQESSSDSGEK